MVNLSHRLFALMLCLCMLFSAAFSLAEESAAIPSGEGTEAMDGESAWSLRFGRDAVVETSKHPPA